MKIPENQISNAITTIKNDSNFNNHYRKILDEIKKLNTFTFEDFYKICEQIENISKNIPNSASVSVRISASSSTTVALYDIFKKIFTKFNLIYSIPIDSFINLMPKFVYLDEEMELKGVVRKNTSWKNTLKGNNNLYSINVRLFSVLDINLEEFDKKPIEEQDLILQKESVRFSRDILRKHWNENIGLDIRILGDRISFKIIEYDKENIQIFEKITFPESRSKGFKWYLAYLITLEYMKILKIKRIGI